MSWLALASFGFFWEEAGLENKLRRDPFAVSGQTATSEDKKSQSQIDPYNNDEDEPPLHQLSRRGRPCGVSPVDVAVAGFCSWGLFSFWGTKRVGMCDHYRQER